MTARSDDEELWSAIAEPGRRRLLDILLAGGSATATALAAQLPFTRQAVAKHLAVLERVELVEAHRQGREVLYSVRPERLEAAAKIMAEAASAWDARLRRIKAIAESLHQAAE